MRARSLIKRLIRLYDGIPLGARLPETPNPFRTSSISQLPILQSQALQGLSNIPTSAAALPTTTPATGQQTALKGQQVFGTNDTIFGVG